MGYRLKIGDMFSIPTKIGLGFFQVTPHFKNFPLVRVIDFINSEVPENIEKLASMPYKFFTLTFVVQMANKKISRLIGNAKIPDDAVEFPPMVGGGGFWPDGTQQRFETFDRGIFVERIDTLTDEQKKMTDDGIIGAPVLISYIEKNWRPEQSSTRTGIRQSRII